MKTRKPSANDLRNSRWRLRHSALAVAMSSLTALANAAPVDDNLDGMLTFYSKPQAANVPAVAGGEPKAVSVTSAPAASSSQSTAQMQPMATPSATEAASSAPANKVVPSTQATPLDMSLPEEIKTSVSASDLGDAESSLAYIREMVSTALRISPEMKQADANWQAAKGDVDQAKGARWPQIQVAANSKQLQSGHSDYGNGGTTSVQMVTPIYDFGAISHTIDSRTKTANAQEEAKAQSEVAVAYNTASSVVELAHQQNALEISDRYVERMRELVSMLSKIAEVDPGRRSEVTQARSRLLQAETAREVVRSKYQETKTTLAKLVGEDVTVPANAKWDWTPIALDDALAQMIEQPALRQARWEKEAALANADSVKSSRFPKVNWVVGRSTGSSMLDSNEPWSTGLALEWTAFSGGSAAAAQRAAYARADAADQKMEATRRESEYRVRNLVQQRDLAASRMGDYKDLLLESDRVRKMFYDQWYHLGKRTLLDVLIAENEYYSTQIAASQTYYETKMTDLRIRSETSGLMAWLAPGSESATR